jgi:hypothetical protein
MPLDCIFKDILYFGELVWTSFPLFFTRRNYFRLYFSLNLLLLYGLPYFRSV